MNLSGHEQLVALLVEIIPLLPGATETIELTPEEQDEALIA